MAIMKKAAAKPKTTKKPTGPVFVLKKGVGLDPKTGKTYPLPTKSAKPKPLPTISDAEYLKRQKQAVKENAIKEKKK